MNNWNGYEVKNIKVNEHDAFIVCPKNPNGKWAIKTEYFEHFPDVQLKLLEMGYHIAHVINITRWHKKEDSDARAKLCEYMVKELGLDKKCSIIGMSCGGLYACKVAAKFPEFIDVLYIDAPVMNLLSCPLGLGIGKPHVIDECLDALKLTMSQMLSYRDNPIDKMDVLIKNDIPVVLVVGDSDDIVPFCENGALLEKYYNENGGKIVVYIKENCGHHPHGLEDYKGLVDQIEKFSKQ